MVKKSDILVAAKQRIIDMDNQYICYAIDDVPKGTIRQKRELKVWILDLLGDYDSYEWWIRYNYPDTYLRVNKEPFGFRDGRVQWLDWMISELKKKGE